MEKTLYGNSFKKKTTHAENEASLLFRMSLWMDNPCEQRNTEPLTEQWLLGELTQFLQFLMYFWPTTNPVIFFPKAHFFIYIIKLLQNPVTFSAFKVTLLASSTSHSIFLSFFYLKGILWPQTDLQLTKGQVNPGKSLNLSPRDPEELKISTRAYLVYCRAAASLMACKGLELAACSKKSLSWKEKKAVDWGLSSEGLNKNQ